MDESAAKLHALMNRVVRVFGMRDEIAQACCGISEAQCRALTEIGRAGTLSLGALAEAAGLDKSTMSRTVDSLVKCGCVERTAVACCRRSVAIRLTPKGRAHYEGIEQKMAGYFGKVWDGLPEGKRAQVLESLSLLLAAVDHMDQCGGVDCNG